MKTFFANFIRFSSHFSKTIDFGFAYFYYCQIFLISSFLFSSFYHNTPKKDAFKLPFCCNFVVIFKTNVLNLFVVIFKTNVGTFFATSTLTGYLCCSDHLKNGEKLCIRVCFNFFSFLRKISYHK